MIKKLINYSISIIILLFVWICCAVFIKSELILPYPQHVLKSFFLLIKTAQFWKSLSATFLRVIIAFILSLLIGTVIGYLQSVSDFIKDLFEIPISIIRSTPVIAVIVVALFWFKSTVVPVFVAVLMALPIVTTNVLYGLSINDENKLLLSKVYNFSKKQQLIYIKLPGALPNFYSAVNSSFGLCWKVVAAGEVLSLPKNGLGSLMSRSQVYLETSEVMAITMALIIISFILEKLLQRISKINEL